MIEQAGAVSSCKALKALKALKAIMFCDGSAVHLPG
jgi:hypothetical protein